MRPNKPIVALVALTAIAVLAAVLVRDDDDPDSSSSYHRLWHELFLSRGEDGTTNLKLSDHAVSKDQMVVSGPGGLTAVDLHTGDERWRWDAPMPPFSPSPADQRETTSRTSSSMTAPAPTPRSVPCPTSR
jgi:hypothetical protein